MLLEIYIDEDCHTCSRSRQIAGDIKKAFPPLNVRVLDVRDGGGAWRNQVVATPTYILEGATISLGNPARDELRDQIARALSETNDA